MILGLKTLKIARMKQRFKGEFKKEFKKKALRNINARNECYKENALSVCFLGHFRSRTNVMQNNTDTKVLKLLNDSNLPSSLSENYLLRCKVQGKKIKTIESCKCSLIIVIAYDVCYMNC